MPNKEKTPIGEFIEMKYGKMPPTEVLSDEGFPIFSGYRITGYAKEFLYEEPMLILVARGVGGTGDVKISPPNSWITNLSIILSINKEKADKKFLFYKLSNEPLKDNLNTGAAQAQITIDVFSKYKIYLPPILIQKRIAEILSAYDDLIENNLKRIRLLEESARLLYREWFVRLKFPNHEHTPLINGLPEGWESGVISDFYDTGSGGTPSRLNPDYFTGDISWIKTQELKDSFIIDTDEKITEEALKHSAAKLFPAKTVLVAMYGATIGQLGITACPATTNQACCALMPRVQNANYIYAFLFLKENKQQLINLAMGAAQNNINQQTVRNFEMILPSERVMENFVEITEPMFKAISNFLEQNQKLKQARDLLLPRLMSGDCSLTEYVKFKSSLV